jgi:hypothetical protein
VYAGVAPPLSIDGDLTDIAGLLAAVAGWQAQAADWLSAVVVGLGQAAKDAILLVDTDMPLPLDFAAMAALVGAYYVQSPGRLWAIEPWKKLWLTGQITPPRLSLGAAAGAVYIVDASPAALAGQYVPFGNGPADLPAVYVDRDSGAHLRKAASARPLVRLTMTASITRTSSPSLVAILPGDGSSDETLILNTHSDGTNFVEENGTLGLVELARYFRRRQQRGHRLRRSLVFSCVTGHFNGWPPFPQTKGFVDDHPDLIKRAAAALTIEHLGVTEWLDDARGYHPSGLPEPGVMYVDERLTALTLDSFVRYRLPNHALARSDANLYFGVGGPLHSAGVPSLSFLTGPTYLCQTVPDGCLDKLDPQLMRLQINWFADLLQRIDQRPRLG